MAKQTKSKLKVTFSLAAPEAQTVLLAGDFTSWQQAPLALKKSKAGVWKKAVSLPAGRYEYRFLVDGEWRNDPLCTHRQQNEFGAENCVCVVSKELASGEPA